MIDFRVTRLVEAYLTDADGNVVKVLKSGEMLLKQILGERFVWLEFKRGNRGIVRYHRDQIFG